MPLPQASAGVVPARREGPPPGPSLVLVDWGQPTRRRSRQPGRRQVCSYRPDVSRPDALRRIQRTVSARRESAGRGARHFRIDPLRVLHVIPSVDPLRGGPSVMLRTLPRALARVGIEVHVATTDDNDHQRSPRDRREPIQEDGVTYWYFKRRFRFYSVCPPLGRWLGAHVQDYHLIHIHALFNYPAVAASAWAWRRRIPYIVRPLGTLNRWGMQHRRPWVKKVSFPLIERRILAHAALVHYTSEQERLEATELGVRAPSAVIPNALDGVNLPAADPAAFRARYPQLRDRSVVLFLSRLDQK